MGSHVSTEEIEQFVLGLLPEERLPTFEEHLASCAECAKALAEEAQFEVAVTAAVASSGRAPGRMSRSHWSSSRLMTYVGNTDYHHQFAPASTYQVIKLDAMRHFGLEASAANKYVLQHDKADLLDNGHIGTLGQTKVTLTLVLMHEVPKGCVRA